MLSLFYYNGFLFSVVLAERPLSSVGRSGIVMGMLQPSNQPQAQLDFTALRAMVSIDQVLGLIDWQAVARNGDQLRGPCPIHKSSSERSRSFSVSLTENAYQCFGCGKKGNQLDLAVELFGLPLYQASRELCQRLGIEPPTR